MPVEMRSGEIVVVGQPLKYPARRADAGKRFCGGRRHARQKGCFKEKRLNIGVCFLKDLVGEVVEYLGWGESLGRLAAGAVELHALDEEYEARDPSVCLFMQEGKGILRDFPRGFLPDDSGRLLPRQSDLIPGDKTDYIVCTQACEILRRGVPADHDHREPFRDAGKADCHHIVKRRLIRYLVVVVQHDDRRGLEPSEELLEISSGKYRDAQDILGRKQRHGFAEAGNRLSDPQSQIKEKGGNIRITRIEAVPEVRRLPGMEIAADEACLPRTGRAGDPDDRPASQAVENAEHPFSRHDARWAGRCNLKKRRHSMVVFPDRFHGRRPTRFFVSTRRTPPGCISSFRSRFRASPGSDFSSGGGRCEITLDDLYPFLGQYIQSVSERVNEHVCRTGRGPGRIIPAGMHVHPAGPR